MSLNPFTNQRKKREEAVQQQISQLHEYEETSTAPHPSQLSQFAASSAPDPVPPSFPLPSREVDYEAEDLSKYLPNQPSSPDLPLSGFKGTTTYEPPSRARQCLSRLQSGFMIGGALGGAIGFLYGTFTAIKYRHVLYIPIAVVQFGAGFGFFLCCGTVIRCDELKHGEQRRREDVTSQ